MKKTDPELEYKQLIDAIFLLLHNFTSLVHTIKVIGSFHPNSEEEIQSIINSIYDSKIDVMNIVFENSNFKFMKGTSNEK